MANEEPNPNSLSAKLAGVAIIMNGDMGIMKIIKDSQVIFQRNSSYFFLELDTSEEA